MTDRSPASPFSTSSAALPWRDGTGRLHVTVIVKATYALTPGGLAVPAPPLPLFEESAGDPARRTPRTASDRVPFKPRADVLVTGALPPSRPGAARSIVDIGVARGAEIGLLKRLVAGGPRTIAGSPSGPSAQDPLGLGPIAPSAPTRASHLPAGLSPDELFRKQPLSLPRGLDARFFQSAPSDQQMGYLRGGEHLRLAGLHPDLAVLACRLPALHAFARLSGEAARDKAVPLVGDTLWIDMDALVACVTFRGSFEIPFEIRDDLATAAAWTVTAGMAPCEDAEETLASPRGWALPLSPKQALSSPPSPTVDPVTLENHSGFVAGKVAWSPEPSRSRRTVIVKLTLDLPASPGTATLAEEQLPLRGDEYTSEMEASLAYPSDHAPFKPKADVLLRGVAPAAPGKTSPPISLSLGAFEARGVALAALDPVSPASPARRALAGTFTKEWQERRWPCFPRDFDPAYLQAAPAPFQTPHLRGDEPFRITGARPDGGVIEGSLPGLRPRAFVLRDEKDPSEVPLALDTVLFDAEAGKGTLVFRGSFELASDREAARVVILSEDMARPRALDDLIDEVCLHSAQPDFKRAARPRPGKPPASCAIEDLLRLPSKRAAAGAVAVAVSAFAAARARPRLPDPPPPPSREDIQSRLQSGKGLSGLDLSGADLRGLDLSGADLRGALLQGANLEGANLRRANLTGAHLRGIDASDSVWDAADLTRADLSKANLSRASFAGATLEQATFSGADLQSARLNSSAADGASFVGASLKAARADGAHLKKADFTEAKMEEASFRGADLSDAKLHEVQAPRTVFDEALLLDARFEKASLPGASFQRIRGRGAVWEQADLRKALFGSADVTGAVLSGATLVQADLRGVLARTAVLREADLTDARLDGADLMRATFEGACLRRAVLRGASLHQAETWMAVLDGADLTGAILTGSKLAGA